MLEKVNLAAAVADIDDQWVPRTVGSYNGDHVQVIRVEGEFVWHHHDRTDDLFLCIKGHVCVQTHEGDIDLGPGDMLIVPVGVEHCVRADEEAHLLVLEHLGDDAAEHAEAELSGPLGL